MQLMDLHNIYILWPFHMTVKGNLHVTFAAVASETQNASVKVQPYCGLIEGSYVTAREIRGKMVQLWASSSPGETLCSLYLGRTSWKVQHICSCLV
ncbi:hypothetical protein PTKIN_Ptkin01aG0143600 [Pterospermum kingtungense]